MIKRLLLCLDGSEADKTMLKYVSFIAPVIKPEKIYFLHVARSLDIPQDIQEKYPDLLAPVDESIKKVLAESIKENFSYTVCECELEVREGNATEYILKYSQRKDIDLMVFGKKSKGGDGLLPGKMAKLAGCSLLFVSDGTPLQLKKIFVPTDFSDSSVRAMKIAQDMSAACNASITVAHTYTVPTGYYKTGKTFDEFLEIMRGHAENDQKAFTKKNNLKEFNCTFLLDKKGTSTARIIYDELEKEKPDLIIMGSKGRTGAAGWILGSVADKMTRIHYPYNLMVVKDRKENLNFLEALMKI